MTEPDKPAPAKKRAFFKKAAWQTKKDTGENERDIFSHSNEFADIIAEENKRKQEQRRWEEKEKRRKLEEKHIRKRQRISSELEDILTLGGQAGIESQVGKLESKEPNRAPVPPPSSNIKASLGARYNSLIEASILTAPRPKPESNVIDLGDSESESEEPSKNASNSSIPLRPSRLSPSDDIEEIEDPIVAALEAQARARIAEKDVNDNKLVELFITTNIPGTNPLLVKYKIGSTLQKAREAWCQLQKFSPEVTRDVFFTWKHKRVHDSTKVKRLGIKVDHYGCISVEGTSEIYDDENLPRVHVEAFTEELFQDWERQQAEEAAARKRAAETPPPVEEAIQIEEQQAEKAMLKLILKTKSKPDFKISVHPETTIEHLTVAYRKKRQIPDNQPITLMFDGERLRPMDTIADTDIEDMESIEVYFK